MSSDQPGPEQWRAVRQHLNQHRFELADIASARYAGRSRVAGTRLLAVPAAAPGRPMPLSQVALAWQPDPARPAVDGTGPDAVPVLPPGYRRYADAIGALDRPALFEDRPAYRLLSAVADRATDGAGPVTLTFGPGRYFDAVSVGEAICHELAASEGSPVRLPLRDAIGDPADFSRRPAMTAVCVLTLRQDQTAGTVTFPLHWRDPARVTSGGGLYQVMPVGIFQQGAPGPAACRADLDLWRAIVREYSEEFLGTPEDYGDGSAPFDYDGWPLYAGLASAIEQGQVRAWYLGLGVDPLSLAVDVLVATVVDAPVYDELFAGLVARNDEGIVLKGGRDTGFSFDQATVAGLIATQPFQAAGAAVLTLAGQARDTILGQ